MLAAAAEGRRWEGIALEAMVVNLKREKKPGQFCVCGLGFVGRVPTPNKVRVALNRRSVGRVEDGR